jgi:hypothetical protein
MRGYYSTQSILFNVIKTAVLLKKKMRPTITENFPLYSKANKASHKYGINNQWPAVHNT